MEYNKCEDHIQKRFRENDYSIVNKCLLFCHLF